MSPEMWQIIERVANLTAALSGIAALILAIYVARQDVSIKNFNKLLDKNNQMVELISEQNAEMIRQKNLERKSYKTQLRQSWLAMSHEKGFGGGLNEFKESPLSRRVEWIQNTLVYLKMELRNPFLLEDDTLFEKWANLHSNCKMTLDMISTPGHKVVVIGDEGPHRFDNDEKGLEQQRLDMTQRYYDHFHKVWWDFFDVLEYNRAEADGRESAKSDSLQQK